MDSACGITPRGELHTHMNTAKTISPKPLHVEHDAQRAVHTRLMRHVKIALRDEEIEAITEAQSKVRLAQNELADLLDSICMGILSR